MKKFFDLRVSSYPILKKLIMGLKIAILLAVVSVTTVLASDSYSQGAKVSIDMKNAPLEKVMDEIERQTEFYFIFNQKQIDVNRVVDIQVENRLITDILPELLKGTNVNFAILDRKILLTTEPLGNSDAIAIASIIDQQQTKLSGTIKDAVTGDAMTGVNVQIKGTTLGSITDIDGNYSINISDPNVVLVFSFIGYKTIEVPTGGKFSVDVKLEPDMATLNEVVVIGYGTVKKKDLTGSVGSIQSKELREETATRIDQVLMGKVAGVQVIPVTGAPGDAPTIRIRGVGSITAGSGPLYVVDGFPIDDIRSINPGDIESIDILKDASASAIYGSRGSNGVIIINTKRGKSGKTKISFDTYYGWQSVSKVPTFLSASEEAMYYYLGVKNRNIDAGTDVSGPPNTWKFKPPQLIVDYVEGRNTTNIDALNAVLVTAPQQQYQLSASGGDQNVRYAVSGEYLDQDGIVLNSNFKRYSMRANLDAKLTPKLNMKMDFSAAKTNDKIVNTSGAGNGANEGVIGQAVGAPYYYPLFNPDGSYFVYNNIDASVAFYNPVALAKEIYSRGAGTRFLGNVRLDYEFNADLKLNVLLGATSYNTKTSRFRPNLPVFFGNPALGSDNTSHLLNWLSETTLNYTKILNKHSLSGVLGFTAQEETFQSNFLTSDKYPNNLVPTLSAVSGIITNGSSDESQWSLVSYLGRFNYNYDGKYYLTASIRTDGSSRFGANKRYGIFPSVALAWRISDETFLKDIKPLSELKIRTSYGETGNNNIGNYMQYATINYGKYTLGGAAVGSYSPARVFNPNLTWEKQRSLNIGVDAAFLDTRVGFTLDYFSSRNNNLLLNVNVPSITGFNTALQNIGEVSNKGWEFVVRTVNIRGSRFEWTTDVNLSTFHNKVIHLGPNGDPIISGYNITMIGQPVGMFYGLFVDGIYKTQADIDKGPIYNPGSSDHSRVGDLRFRDVSGPDGKPDGIINSLDNTIIGSPYPDFYYGMTNKFSYGNLSMTVSFQGSQGNKVRTSNIGLYGRSRVKTLGSQKDYWKSEEEPGDGMTPRPNDGATGGIRLNSTRFIDNGSYLRINNISLAYVLAEKVTKNLSLGSLRIYVSASNPILFTKYSSFNPDVSNTNNSLTPGNDVNNYPLPKSYLIGLNITF